MMRRSILAAVLVAILLAGCQTITEMSPEQRWAGAATIYATTLDALTDLKVAGVLDDDDKARIEPYRAAARAAIDAMEASIGSGAGDFEQAWSAFSAAIDAMIREQAAAGGGA